MQKYLELTVWYLVKLSHYFEDLEYKRCFSEYAKIDLSLDQITEIKEQFSTNYLHVGCRRIETCGRFLKSGIATIIRNYNVGVFF